MFIGNIKKLTRENNNFRKVMFTAEYSQLVLMSIPKGEDIGEEIHHETDQILVLVRGQAEAIVNNLAYDFGKHDVLFIPAGTKHNIINIGDEDLKLYTIYALPEHPDGTVFKTKADSQKYESEKKEELKRQSANSMTKGDA